MKRMRGLNFLDENAFALDLDPQRTFTEEVGLLAQAYERGELVAYCHHYYDLYFLLAGDSITSRLGGKEHADIKKSIREVDELYGVQKPQDFYATLGSSPAFAFDASFRDAVSRCYDSERIYYGRKPPFLEIMKRVTGMRERFLSRKELHKRLKQSSKNLA